MSFEIILYGTLAVIMVVVLWSVLGQQVGRGPDENTRPEDIFGTTDDFKSKPTQAEAQALAAVPGGMVAATPTPTDAIRARDADFDVRVFKDQATTAYAMVLEAFADGDRETLDMLLTERMSGIYTEAVEARESQELTQATDILRILDTDVVDVRTSEAGRELVAEIDVRFSSELSSALLDSVGQAVQGDPDLVAKVKEVWTFTRTLGAGDDGMWKLSDVAPETGDTLEADPAPDTTD